jgi:hypothetical protein
MWDVVQSLVDALDEGTLTEGLYVLAALLLVQPLGTYAYELGHALAERRRVRSARLAGPLAQAGFGLVVLLLTLPVHLPLVLYVPLVSCGPTQIAQALARLVLARDDRSDGPRNRAPGSRVPPVITARADPNAATSVPPPGRG